MSRLENRESSAQTVGVCLSTAGDGRNLREGHRRIDFEFNSSLEATAGLGEQSHLNKAFPQKDSLK